jgi:phosphatidylserine/phosphatidylglycerophosphate/cardiolipin synthase-like enzyme
MIVDDDYVVVGSTNWSYFAFEESNETSVVIESRELNQHYADYIESIIEAGEPY